MSIIGIIQLISAASVQENLNQVHLFCEKAKEAGASLVVLPENFAFMGLKERDKLGIAEEFGQGPIQNCLKEFAKSYGIWIIGGTLPLHHSDDKVFASSLVFNNAGECVARYDKIHLFDVRISDVEHHHESKTVASGKKIVVIDTPVGRVGLSVCYDLRFPELYRQMTLMGAELFSVPSAFTAITGAAHWEVLLRARGIENLCYVLAPNQGGTHQNGRDTYGHSMVVGPWGDVLGQLPMGEGLLVVEINLQKLKELRTQFPCNQHHVLNFNQ